MGARKSSRLEKLRVKLDLQPPREQKKPAPALKRGKAAEPSDEKRRPRLKIKF